MEGAVRSIFIIAKGRLSGSPPVLSMHLTSVLVVVSLANGGGSKKERLFLLPYEKA